MLRKILFSILVASLLLAACGPVSPEIAAENATLQAELQVVIPAAATEAAQLPETMATQTVGMAIESVYESDPNVAALLPRSLCPSPIIFWGEDDEVGWICSNHTLEDLANGQSFEADLAVVGVAALTPVPGDEILAVVLVGAKRVVIIIATAAAADYISRGMVEMSSRHTSPTHNPNKRGSVARANISAILTVWSILLTQGPEKGPGPRCGAIKNGETIVTMVIWIAEAFRPTGGYVVVYRPGNTKTPWLSSYDRSVESFQSGPRANKLPPGHVWDGNVPCPDELPGLQPAAP